MENYIRPIVEVNSDFAEGIYAASGVNGTHEATCWSINAFSVQEWDGSSHVFETHIEHNGMANHISEATYVTLTFNFPVVAARSEFETTFSGNTVVIKRALLGDAYMSGDSVTYKVWVQGADEATTKAMSIIGYNVSCDKAVNVQGNGGDE